MVLTSALLEADSDGQYASGYLLYHLQSALLAQKFDPATGVLSGDPAPVANFVEYDTGTWHTNIHRKPERSAGLRTGLESARNRSRLDGPRRKDAGQGGGAGVLQRQRPLSPDGKRLAMSMGESSSGISGYST